MFILKNQKIRQHIPLNKESHSLIRGRFYNYLNFVDSLKRSSSKKDNETLKN